jgi:hypothetical protein
MQLRSILAGVAVLTLMQVPAAAQYYSDPLAGPIDSLAKKYEEMREDRDRWKEKEQKLEHQMQNMDRETQQFMPGWNVDRNPSEPDRSQQSGRYERGQWRTPARRRPEVQDD